VSIEVPVSNSVSIRVDEPSLNGVAHDAEGIGGTQKPRVEREGDSECSDRVKGIGQPPSVGAALTETQREIEGLYQFCIVRVRRPELVADGFIVENLRPENTEDR